MFMHIVSIKVAIYNLSPLSFSSEIQTGTTKILPKGMKSNVLWFNTDFQSTFYGNYKLRKKSDKH